ncbi:NAD(+) synthase [Mycoplasmoides pirum]|uniref:NAD(+) synthase n=1 Tax=Mycoplasmoides pirum TaxID=2122 RepID=UPI0004894733|nr:NAD(+) synthase [Mycoplasmoides pirum]
MKISKYAKYLENWVFNQVKKANAKGIVFGLSGGVDSAVIAGIAKTVFLNNHLAIVMHINNSELDVKCTNKIIKDFNLINENLDLNSSFKCLAKSLNLCLKNDLIILGNLKSRLRTISLYALAQKYNYLVCGTSNYDEWITGYFTKYGDSACDLAPLRNCLKSDVYELADYYKVPKIIVNRQPSASLLPNQTDEKDLGFKYKELDKHLLNKEKLSSQQEKRLNNLIIMSEHKRKLPIAPKSKRKLLK